MDFSWIDVVNFFLIFGDESALFSFCEQNSIRFNQAYTKILEETVQESFKMVGIQFIAKNYAMGKYKRTALLLVTKFVMMIHTFSNVITHRWNSFWTRSLTLYGITIRCRH